jgi:hypothetical protein
MECRGGWVLEVDIRKFFDNLDHGHLRTFLRLRVRDGVLLRRIDKWLKAGVMEGGCVSYPDAGTPQGGVVSPMLSNVFLHYVLDLWFEQDVKPRMRHRALLIRYADDFVIGFRDHRDAQRVMEVVPKRFGKYGLTDRLTFVGQLNCLVSLLRHVATTCTDTRDSGAWIAENTSPRSRKCFVLRIVRLVRFGNHIVRIHHHLDRVSTGRKLCCADRKLLSGLKYGGPVTARGLSVDHIERFMRNPSQSAG